MPSGKPGLQLSVMPTFRVTPETDKRLDQVAAREGVKKSTLLRDIVEGYLEDYFKGKE